MHTISACQHTDLLITPRKYLQPRLQAQDSTPHDRNAVRAKQLVRGLLNRLVLLAHALVRWI
jgi:hypothetical protein